MNVALLVLRIKGWPIDHSSDRVNNPWLPWVINNINIYRMKLCRLIKVWIELLKRLLTWNKLVFSCATVILCMLYKPFINCMLGGIKKTGYFINKYLWHYNDVLPIKGTNYSLCCEASILQPRNQLEPNINRLLLLHITCSLSYQIWIEITWGRFNMWYSVTWLLTYPGHCWDC